ncbi:hypothetical protein HL670_01152 [Serratia plymuthica]|nr:hypothetical protein HL670_01152 [Serratia plymuthica]
MISSRGVSWPRIAITRCDMSAFIWNKKSRKNGSSEPFPYVGHNLHKRYQVPIL